MIHTMVTVETLGLLGCSYAFPQPSTEPSNRGGKSVDGVQHACDMFMAYIGALRVPYRQDERLATAILRGLDKYLDDLISPRVWIKLDDLVKARSRGEKLGEQQLLNPARKSLAERMTNNINPSNVMGGIERQTPSFFPNSPAFKHGSPSLLHSPASHLKPLQSRPIPTGPRNALQPLRISVPIGPRDARPISPHTSNPDLSDNGVGPKRSRQRSRGYGGPMDQSQRGQGGPRLGIDPLDRWFER
jgi:hypothetical protein